MSIREGLEAHMNDLIRGHSAVYPELTEKWKLLDCLIKTADSNKSPLFRLDIIVLQKKLVTTEMKIINSLRIKDANQYTALLEKYKTISTDLIDISEDNSETLIIDEGSEKEQAYIELCNYLKSQVNMYSNSLELLIKYNNAKKE